MGGFGEVEIGRHCCHSENLCFFNIFWGLIKGRGAEGEPREYQEINIINYNIDQKHDKNKATPPRPWAQARMGRWFALLLSCFIDVFIDVFDLWPVPSFPNPLRG